MQIYLDAKVEKDFIITNPEDIRMKNFSTLPAAILLVEADNKELKVTGCNESGIIVQSGFELDLEQNPIILKYFGVDEYSYKDITIHNYQILESKQLRFCSEYTIEIQDEEYKDIYASLVTQLSMLDEYEADKNNDFHKDYDTAVKEWFGHALKYEDCKEVMEQVQGCFVVENVDDYQMFLNSSVESFINKKLTRLGLEHTFKAANFKRVYIGNQFCHNLFPNKELLLRLMDKAKECNLDITIAFTYMRETLIDQVREQVQLIDDWAQKHNRKIEIIINDWGMLNFLAGKEERLLPVLGVLLNKRKKDPRTLRKIGIEKYTSYLQENNLNTELFQDFLKKHNIERVEYESHIIPNKYIAMKASLHVPYYQTNTSQYCPLYAQCAHLNRDHQELITSCTKYCRNFVMMFPKDVDAIGRYNSIFGIDTAILRDRKVFQFIKDSEVDRLVLNI